MDPISGGWCSALYTRRIYSRSGIRVRCVYGHTEGLRSSWLYSSDHILVCPTRTDTPREHTRPALALLRNDVCFAYAPTRESFPSQFSCGWLLATMWHTNPQPMSRPTSLTISLYTCLSPHKSLRLFWCYKSSKFSRIISIQQSLFLLPFSFFNPHTFTEQQSCFGERNNAFIWMLLSWGELSTNFGWFEAEQRSCWGLIAKGVLSHSPIQTLSNRNTRQVNDPYCILCRTQPLRRAKQQGGIWINPLVLNVPSLCLYWVRDLEAESSLHIDD